MWGGGALSVHSARDEENLGSVVTVKEMLRMESLFSQCKRWSWDFSLHCVGEDERVSLLVIVKERKRAGSLSLLCEKKRMLERKMVGSLFSLCR